jgi:hypothetical protein
VTLAAPRGKQRTRGLGARGRRYPENMNHRLIVSLALLAGCGIDVNRRPIGSNEFLIEAEGRDYHSHADVLEAAHHEAEAACGGLYRILDDVNSQRRRGAHDDLTAKTLDVVLTVRCGAATTLAQLEPPGFWCAHGSSADYGDKFGVCFRASPGRCEAWRTKAPDYGACEQQDHAVCSEHGCFADAGSCGEVERKKGGDGSACEYR